MKLTEAEQRMLAGEAGRLKQVSLENIIRYAQILGAEDLCEVSKATVFCGAHHYLGAARGADYDQVFSRMNLASDEVIPLEAMDANCFIQSCVSPCDQYEHAPFQQSREFFALNAAYLARARQAGVITAGTCAPYLTGWIPIRGEHFVTTESGVTAIGNSIWGAMGNSDGIEAAFWSAICGRTPRWGKHLSENRAGTALIRVEAQVDSLVEWDLLGATLGQRLPSGSIPVIDGQFRGVNFQKLRQLCTTLAVTSNAEMLHLVGCTPEARSIADAFQGKPSPAEIVVGQRQLQETYAAVCDPGEATVDMVSLGCPHYDIDQIKQVAEYLGGKQIKPGVLFMVWTVYPIKKMADENGYTRMIEEAGGFIYTSSCPSTIGGEFLEQHHSFVFDSLKQAQAMRTEANGAIYYGDWRRCVDAAVSGRWQGAYRWSD